MKDVVAANIAEKKKTTAQEVFNNPIYARIIGADYQTVNEIFDNRFQDVFDELQTTFKV
jgi:hypothetical protein